MKYRTIVADPPWPGKWFPEAPGGRRRNVTLPEYTLMTIEEIEALPVHELAEADCRLFLWVPPQLNREGVGVRVMRAWGFDRIDEMVWVKPNLGMGYFPRHCHEMLLTGLRGAPVFTGQPNVRSVQFWRQLYDKNGGKRHSSKPDGAIDLIEQVSQPPYLEVFSRRHRLGWDVWGNESANTAQLDVTA